jgi:hypothetical protein
VESISENSIGQWNRDDECWSLSEGRLQIINGTKYAQVTLRNVNSVCIKLGKPSLLVAVPEKNCEVFLTSRKCLK